MTKEKVCKIAVISFCYLCAIITGIWAWMAYERETFTLIETIIMAIGSMVNFGIGTFFLHLKTEVKD